MIVPSRITCGVTEPCGKAEYSPNLHARTAFESQLAMRSFDHDRDFLVRHANSSANYMPPRRQ